MEKAGTKLNMRVTISDGTQKFVESMLIAKTTAFFEKQVKKWIARYSSVKMIEKAGGISYAVSELMEGISSKEFSERGRKLLELRLKETMRAKFNTRGFGKWRALKPSTIKKRRWMLNVQPGTNPEKKDSAYKTAVIADRPVLGIGGGSNSPLIFTGAMKKAAIKGHNIGKFKFYNKKDYSRGRLTFDKLDIGIGFKEPDIPVPKWYWWKSSKKPFKNLMEFQSEKGRLIPLQKGRTFKEKQDIMKEFTRSESFRRLWSPFVKKDLPKLFDSIKGKGNEPAISKDAMALLNKVVNGLAKGFKVSYSDIRSAITKAGIESKLKQLSSVETNAVKIRKLIKQSILKMGGE